MIHSVNSIGFTPNGNTYKKSKKYGNIGMAAMAGVSAIKNVQEDIILAAKSDKKTIAINAAITVLTVAASALWGKLIGGLLDERANYQRMTDADGAEVKMIKTQEEMAAFNEMVDALAAKEVQRNEENEDFIPNEEFEEIEAETCEHGCTFDE